MIELRPESEIPMPKGVRLTRRSYFVNTRAVRRARRALGAATDAEAVRRSVEQVADMEAFWHFMRKNRGVLKAGSIERP